MGHQGDLLRLRFDGSAPCPGCPGRGVCPSRMLGAGNQACEVDLRCLVGPIPAVGSILLLQPQETALTRAALLLYLLPLVLTMAGAALGGGFGSGLGEAVLAGLGLLLGLLLARRGLARLRLRFEADSGGQQLLLEAAP